MQYVYIVEGLGLGDDESVWERVSVHATQAGAEDRADGLRVDDLVVRVVQEELLP